MTDNAVKDDITLAILGTPPKTTAAALRTAFPRLFNLSEEHDAAQRHIARALAIFGTHAPVGESLFQQLPSLEIVSNCGVGIDHIDLSAATNRNIIVTNTPDVLTEDVADLAVGLLLQTVRELPRAERFLRAGRWEEFPYRLTDSLQGKSVGILGLGRIGKAIARRLRSFGVTLNYHSRHPQGVGGISYFASALELAQASDILIIATPGGEGTQHLVDRQVLAALGERGILINISRGSVVDEQALIEALEGGKLASAGLDVFSTEPHISEAFLRLDNVVLLPHVGSGTYQTRLAMGQLLVDNLTRFFATGEALTPVS